MGFSIKAGQSCKIHDFDLKLFNDVIEPDNRYFDRRKSNF
jgi:hypothetical protein